MKASTFFNVITAAHYSYLVGSEFDSRGGLLLVAPPEQLKTTFIQVLENYPNALVLTDVVTRDLVKIRDQIAAGRYRTIAFPEMQKLYSRDADTASNIEANLHALMEEGFFYIPGSSPSIRTLRAQALVVAGATTSLYNKKHTHWEKSGFLRRILVCLYKMKEPHLLSKAVEAWQKIEIQGGFAWSVPTGISIPHNVTKGEAEQITGWCRWQGGLVDPASMLHRILSVLRWKRKRAKQTDDSFEILTDFSECLMGNGAEVVL